MVGHTTEARHRIAEARATLQSVRANAQARRCVHGGTRGVCRLCAPVEVPVRDERVDRYLVDAE